LTLEDKTCRCSGLASLLAIAVNQADLGVIAWDLVVLIGEIVLIDM
jgi:hypothetical protein